MTGSHISGTTKAERHERSRVVRGAIIFMTIGVGLVALVFIALQSFGIKQEQPEASLACATKLYSPYDPKNLEQCMAVCQACSAGVKTTCSTSCTLRGAR
ncbi:hypothetical protein HMPREF9695_01853 [Afipia broomeae ATCC 49717]|uniref:Uncharacterized protein n=1 Tax=Afipia broomeae ATCC 49717 TaxID=883078 RepID=K8PBA4_9BRAD|nr:hypothetical protein HMPREF9695_01853 [Afipia broomeae ATCC 49717]